MIWISAPLLLAAVQDMPRGKARGWTSCCTYEDEHGLVMVDLLTRVFFDGESMQLSAMDDAILDNFAANGDDPPGCRAELSGHADRAEPGEIQQDLSRRRAETVAAYLRGKGVRSPIVVSAFGASRPLVETAEGVDAPENRRVALMMNAAEAP